MTPEEIEAVLADFQRRIDALQQQLIEQEQRLTRRIEALGDYAGATEYRRRQDAIVADRRLSRLEQQNDDNENQSA